MSHRARRSHTGPHKVASLQMTADFLLRQFDGAWRADGVTIAA